MPQECLEVCPCQIPGIKPTRDQCERRQLSHRRYVTDRGRSDLAPMFVTCKQSDGSFCAWWLSDAQYTARRIFNPRAWELRGREVLDGIV